MNQNLLSIINLYASIEQKTILNGISFFVDTGSIHAIMGPNGSGKSTLSHILMGHPAYEVASGEILFEGESINDMSPDKRAHKGIFLAFQQPLSIPGLSVATFLHEAHAAIKGNRLSVHDFDALLRKNMQILAIEPAFAYRDLNDGFSGGEKKRLEILQMMVLQPKLVILDEIDSGLDIDALKIVAEGIQLVRQIHPSMAIIIITHYQRILNYINPNYVHILSGGKIMQSGPFQLVHELEKKGYDAYR